MTKISTETGDMETLYLTPSEVLQETNILPRDLVTLALTSRSEQRKRRRLRQQRLNASTNTTKSGGSGNNPLINNSTIRRTMMELRSPPAAILPRNDCILLSFGSIRAVANRKAVYMFDTHTEVTISFAEHLSKVYRQRFINNTVRAHYIQQQQLLYDEENDAGYDNSDTEQYNNNIDKDNDYKDKNNNTTTKHKVWKIIINAS